MSLLGEHMGSQHVLRGDHAKAASSYSVSRPQTVYTQTAYTQTVYTASTCGGGMYSHSQHAEAACTHSASLEALAEAACTHSATMHLLGQHRRHFV